MIQNKIKLKKELSLLDVYCIASGAMISSGLFILPGLAYSKAGPAVIVSYFIAGLLAMTGMFSQAELVSAMPKAGGDYFYVTRSMGPAVGTIAGLLTWFSLSLKTAFALIGLGAFLNLILLPLIGGPAFYTDLRFIAFVLCTFFVLLNFLSIKESSRIEVLMVLGLFAILLIYISRGLPAIQIENLKPFNPHGIESVFFTAGFVFISYGGLLKIASIAEEVKDPAKNVPLGMIFSLITVNILYTLVVLVTTGVLDAPHLAQSLTPVSDAAKIFMGKEGSALLSIAATLAFLTTANAGIMAASYYPIALSRDRLLPQFLSRIHKKFRTPYAAILTTGAFISLSILLDLQALIKVASTVLISTFILSNLSVIILRESHLQNYQPRFRAPFYPWLQNTGILFFIFILFEMGKDVFLIKILLIFSGFFIYWFYGRLRTTREFALLHLIERITAKELGGHSLENELKEIIRERDAIVKDRFDHIIEESSVLDIEESIPVQDFFKIVSEKMSAPLRFLPTVLYELLLEREKESTTVISPAIAIPHMIIDGDHTFDILLARCKGGVVFSESAKNVHAVFVLVGTKDERNFHLRALAAIAQIVQDPQFEKRWMAAKNIENLRDIILLGKRARKS